MRARKRLFDLVRLQPHRSIRHCFNEIRASVSQANLEAVFHMDSLQTLRTSLQRWRRGVVPQSPQNYNSIPSMETFPQRYTRNKLDDE